MDGPLWRSMTEVQQYAVRSRAAYRQANTDVFISHTSSVPLLDGPLWGFDLNAAHLTRTDGRSGRREAGIQQHRGAARDGDIIADYGLQISSPLRATLEVTTVGCVEAALVVANHFLHRGDFTEEQFRARYDDSIDRWPYSLKTDLVIGTLIALLDFALPDQKVWIEFDGKIKYQRFLREGEDVTAAVLREKRREERVAEITGWRCLRVTWADLANPERLAARLQNLIDSMARSSRTP